MRRTNGVAQGPSPVLVAGTLILTLSGVGVAEGRATAQDCTGAECFEETPPDEETALDDDAPLADGNMDLRMAKRLHVILRIGAGGRILRFTDAFEQAFDTKATVGVTLRFEAPVHKVLTTGVLLSLYSFGAPAFSRNFGMDISPFLKGRYAFAMGKKRIEAEAYAIFQIGPSLAVVPDNDPQFSTAGGGFNTAITPGFLVWPNERFGAFFEVGYAYAWARFDGVLTANIGQAAIRFGAAFAFY